MKSQHPTCISVCLQHPAYSQILIWSFKKYTSWLHPSLGIWTCLLFETVLALVLFDETTRCMQISQKPRNKNTLVSYVQPPPGWDIKCKYRFRPNRLGNVRTYYLKWAFHWWNRDKSWQKLYYLSNCYRHHFMIHIPRPDTYSKSMEMLVTQVYCTI